MKRVLGLVCLLILIGILVAGLWPFHAPRNAVSWEGGGNGLVFGNYGSVVSENSFKLDTRLPDAFGLEIWLQPQRIRSSGTILAFFGPENKTISFALRQSFGDLVLQGASIEPLRHNKSRLYVDDVFSQPRPTLLAITSGQDGTAIYADGVLLRKAANFKLSSRNFSGRLLVGNSPVTTDNWSGMIRAFALYHRELTAAEVAQHVANWTGGNGEGFAQDQAALALYLFNEGDGSVVHNRIDSNTDFVIPERFFLLHEQFLERPWHEYRHDWNYWKDIAINVAGFIPFGFFFFAYFQSSERLKHAALLTVVLGFAISVTIEVGQSFLPTRNSGMTDLFTNTLGTFVGVLAFGFTSRHGSTFS